MSGYRLCRKCHYDFVSDGPHDRRCEDCLKVKTVPRRVVLPPEPVVPMTEAEYEAIRARVNAVSHIVFR